MAARRIAGWAGAVCADGEDEVGCDGGADRVVVPARVAEHQRPSSWHKKYRTRQRVPVGWIRELVPLDPKTLAGPATTGLESQPQVQGSESPRIRDCRLECEVSQS